MFGIGPLELGIVALIVLLLFGPMIIRRMTKSVKETRKAMREFNTEGDD